MTHTAWQKDHSKEKTSGNYLFPLHLRVPIKHSCAADDGFQVPV